MAEHQPLRTKQLRLLNLELELVRGHLLRWESLGRRLGLTKTDGWSATRKLREAEVKSLEALIQSIEKSK